MRNESIDIVALQEPIKSDFRHHYFLSIDTRTLGLALHSGELLLGYNRDRCDVVSWDEDVFLPLCSY